MNFMFKWAQRTSEILFLPREHKIQIFEQTLACVAADSFSFSGGAEIKQANEKRASEGARLGWAKKLGRSREGVSKKGEGVWPLYFATLS